MGIIKLNNIRTYSFHGCLKEEAAIGGNYSVDVILQGNFSKAEKTDLLTDTVDYCAIFEIVKAEMAIRSKLIEHVARRISDKIRLSFKIITTVEVTVTKIAPPMNGYVMSVSVTVD